MTIERQKVLERFGTYKNDPDAWRWVKDHENDKEIGTWFRVIAQHFERIMLPRLRSSSEALVELFPSQFLWGQETGYRSGIRNGRIYHVKYGTFATGYVCLTNNNFRYTVFAELTKKYPLVEDAGFLGSLMLGVLGERDKRVAFQKDGDWLISLETISDVQMVVPEESVECISLSTKSSAMNLYVLEELPFTLTAINMARFGQLDSTSRKSDPEATTKNDHVTKLQQLKEMLNSRLITQAEYEEKKQEILSRL